MNNARKATASSILALLIFAIWTIAGFSQGNSTRQAIEPARPESGQAKPIHLRQSDIDEKLVRDVYARLMRYHSAAQDETAAREDKSSQPEDYLTFELRNIRAGAIEEILNRPLTTMVTARNGAVLTITPNHLSSGDGVSHAYYAAKWTTSTVAVTNTTIGETLRRGNAGPTRYISYEVTARLQGQKRTYQAMLLYRGGDNSRADQTKSAKPASVEIWDNVTSEMNAVLKDDSPPLQAPWDRYVRSDRYRAVVNQIKKDKATGNELIPADAPIGYLPGDNVPVVFSPSNEACPPPTVTLSATGFQESGKSTHYISLLNSGNVVITATLAPPGTDPAEITWTGGTAGADNLHRIVASTAVANVDITATLSSGASDTVRIHVVDAAAPPAAAVNAPKTFTNGGTATTGSNFGLTVVTIGQQGVTRPTYHIDPFFNNDRWVFRVRDIAHSYRLGINSQGRINLPNGNPAVFPLAPGLNLTQSHTEARDDFDTTGLTNTGPRRRSYWVEAITQNHENAHVDHFYSAAFWLAHMGLFESTDVEGATIVVVFDCNDNTTMTGTAAVTRMTPTWDANIATRHGDADSAEMPSSEQAAHGVSNPQYGPIRSAIPNP